jgi:early secretory antigenic target protein ESAT-6
MAADGQVVVSAGALDNAASDTDAIAGQIEQQLSDLKGYLAPLVATWTGQASTDWQSLQQQWNTTADDLNTVLRQISTTLRTSAESYTSGENTNAQMWQG